MSVFTRAGQAEILRSSQKDELYMQHLHSETSEVFRSIFGIHKWLKYRNHLRMCSDFVYYSTTTLSGLQTLGEEYVNIVQTDSTLKQVPLFIARLLSTTCHISFPYLFEVALKNMQRHLHQTPGDLLPDFLKEDRNRQRVIVILHLLQKNIPALFKIHSIMFFIFGTYYHISKRLFGIQYIILRSWLKDVGSKNVYKILGLMSLFQFAISVAIEFASCESKLSVLGDASTAEEAGKVSLVESKDKCPLCLAKRAVTTATPCGHLFCWNCITNWMDQRKECPLCRDQFPLSRLVCLQNFD